MIEAAIWPIHGRVRVVLAQSGRILVQVDDVLREIARRRELAEEELVHIRSVHWCLVDGRGHFEDEVIRWRLAEQLECTSLVEDQEVRILYEAEGGVVRNACRAESNRVCEIRCDIPEEMVRQNRRVSVNANDVCSRRTAFLRYRRRDT